VCKNYKNNSSAIRLSIAFCIGVCNFQLAVRFISDSHDKAQRKWNFLKLGRMRWAGHVACMGEEGGCIGSWWGNRREGDHWGSLGVDGWIILELICRRWDVGIWTGLGWPRIVTGGGRL
jgi:hypothetical protein